MRNIFSLNFWTQTIVSTLFTMVIIYLIKKVTSNVKIPLVSDIAQAV